ncbi:MAG: hypothetical protein UU23_C0001G0049 [Candidatus Curtissbacteria bacterium GW2011_GWA1_40_9]|uniref:Membrane protein 6-pyruvoyl-tetrahydropterin synthase-related domain-containing protein n=1 Tax=Candidatus Curtissbacteria bacterium GW2011_GWA1_40_9 TaxID=1618408 RepID=A0A0G0W1W8_9BACT|nr:MAG: hypothetical protein UU23_C0001G0049 [Candidatus Curtissbacteria bacterium GW2011_GWA1_40_9]
MIKNYFKKLWPIAILVMISIGYHFNLFWPTPSIYVTPDYGRSDLIHSKIPTQYLMWKNLHERNLPLWEKDIYQGYPVLDGLEMGFFYLPNLLFFSFLPFWLAFNLGYVVNAILVSAGTYLLSRSFGFNKSASLVAALTFAYSPIFTLHYHHYNLILGMAAIPWLFWLINSFFNTKRIIFLTIVPFVLAEQYFAGSPQIPTYNLFFLSAFYIYKLKQKKLEKKSHTKLILLFLATIFLGLLITSIQLIPTYFLIKTSKWFSDTSPQAILTQFPFKFRNLLTIIQPYILGNPKYGTYPHWQPGNWGIFWESNAYFGIIQFVLLISSLFLLFRKSFNNYKNLLLVLLAFFFLGFTLSLGHQAPLHPIFSMPPFSFFRVPSRFLFISFFSAALICALVLNNIKKTRKRIISYLLLVLIPILVTIDIFRVWKPYSQVGSIDMWLSPPEITNSIQSDRIASIGQHLFWNDTFYKNGWSENSNDYFFYRNFLNENLNLQFNISHLYGYESIVPNRMSLVEQLSRSQIKLNEQEYQIGNISEKVLDFSNVRYLTIPYKLSAKNWRLVRLLEHNNKSIYLYENLDFLQNAYIVDNYKVAKNRMDFSQILNDENYDPRNSVILEEEINLPKQEGDQNNSEILSLNKTNNKVEIQVKTDKSSILVLSDSYYKGWKAFIDGHQTKIYPANANSRAIILPRGTSSIMFDYRPRIITTSLFITLAALLTSIVIIWKSRNAYLS